MLHQEKQAAGFLFYNESVNGVILVVFSCRLQIVFKNMGPVVRKHVFGVSKMVMLKPACSATETS